MRRVASTNKADSRPVTERPSRRFSIPGVSVSQCSTRIWKATDTVQGAHQGVRPSHIQSGFRIVTASYPQEVKTWQNARLLH